MMEENVIKPEGFIPQGADLSEITGSVLNVKNEVSKYVIGQNDMIDLLLISIFSGGHVLLEGVPGIAKTLTAKVIAKTFSVDFSRIQFTPDLMPSDIIGTSVYNQQSGKFTFNKGPVFSNIVLIDEINRSPAKTQAALFEVMEERQISYDGITYPMEFPFLVLATQNPIEQEGTYPLPEAQLDRFMFNIWVDYPKYEEELAIVKSTTGDFKPSLNKILNDQEILFFQQLIRKVPVSENVMEYAVKLSGKTRPASDVAPAIVKKYISWGAGPSASQYLVVGAKCHAVLKGKYSPDIEDVKAVAEPILRHRIVRNYMAEAEGYSVEKIISELL